MMAAGDGLVDGSPREQVLALAARTEPVTAVSSFRVHPGHEDEFDEFQARLDAAVARWPGFLRVERFEPVHGVQEETVVVFSFDTREHLDAWLRSDERRDLLAAADRHVAGDRTVNFVGGFGGWFESAGGPVKRWKQMLIVLLALVPITLGLTWLRLHLVPDLAWPVAGVISNVIGVALLTWVLMPALTRLFDDWLRR
jgi:antibiotic biosynthesis monooxygenase (ABM) superfamily enzyme